jgi:flagellar biogenesis protein FliO
VNNPFDRLPIDTRLKKVLPYLISVVLLVIVLVAAFISAETSNQAAAPSQPDSLGLLSPSSSFDITLDIVLKIIFVFGLIYLFFALLRWWQKKQPGQVESRLRIIESIRPSPRQTFYLLKVGSQEFLVGATDQSMSLISEIEPDMMAELEEQQPAENKFNQSGFKNILQNSMKQTLNLFQKNTPEEILPEPQQQVIK